MSISSCFSRPFSLFAGIALLTASGICAAAESSVIKGEVVSVDLTSNTAVIHPQAGGDTFTVKLPETVVLAGAPASTSELKKGHLVTLKFASRQ